MGVAVGAVVGVAVGEGVAVGAVVEVAVGEDVAVGSLVAVAVDDGVAVGLLVGDGVAVADGSDVGVGNDVAVGSGVSVRVACAAAPIIAEGLAEEVEMTGESAAEGLPTAPETGDGGGRAVGLASTSGDGRTGGAWMVTGDAANITRGVADGDPGVMGEASIAWGVAKGATPAATMGTLDGVAPLVIAGDAFGKLGVAGTGDASSPVARLVTGEPAVGNEMAVPGVPEVSVSITTTGEATGVDVNTGIGVASPVRGVAGSSDMMGDAAIAGVAATGVPC